MDMATGKGMNRNIDEDMDWATGKGMNISVGEDMDHR